VSVVIMTSSVSRSLSLFAHRLAGPAPLRVIGATSEGGLEQSVLPAVLRTPGVAAAIPMVQVVTDARTGAGKAENVVALGVDCSVQELVGQLGCTTQALNELDRSGGAVISGSLSRFMGTSGYIETDGAAVPATRSFPIAALNGFNAGRVAVFSLPTAQRLFGREGRLDVIYVLPAKGTSVSTLRSRLASAVGGWNGVLSSSDPPPAVAVVTGAIVPIFALLSLFAMGVAGVLVFNIMTLAVEERRRELAIVAALGGTPRTVVSGAALEGLLIGAAGGLLGVAGGALLARPLTSSVSSFTRLYIGVTIAVHVTAAAVITGLLLGALVGGVASALPTRRAMRMDVAAELSTRELGAESRPAAYARRALLFLTICGAGMVGAWIGQRNGSLQPWQATIAPIGALVVSVAFLLASGALASMIAAGLRYLPGTVGPERLGLSNLGREGRRAGVMTVAIGAGIATAFVISSTHAGAQAAISKSITSGHPQELYVSTLGPNNTFNVDAKPSPTLISSLERLPGVARVDRSYFILSGHDSKDLVGVSAFEDAWLTNPVVAGTKSLASFNSGNVLVGVTLARSHHLRPGSHLVLDTPQGFAAVTVGGIWQDGNLAGNAVTMPAWLFERLYGRQPPVSIGLLPAPGVSMADLAARTARVDPRLVVETPSQLAGQVSKSVAQQLAPFDAMQRALLAVAFVAVLSTLLLVGVQRRREFGLLSAVGMEPSQTARMTVAEGAGAGLIGVALAVIGSVVIEIAFAWVLPIDIGYKDPLRLDFASLAVWVPASLALVVAATVLPAWRNARLEVVEALQYE
jgi:putative ABC transport system permease protein